MKKLFLLILLTIITIGFAPLAKADSLVAGPLAISYDGNTIFSEINIAPGNKVDKTIKVKNNGAIAHSLGIATRNVTGNFGSSILLTPNFNENDIWTESIETLSKLPEQSKTVVDSINPGDEINFRLTATIKDDLGNIDQNSTTTFSLVFGPQEQEPVVNPIIAAIRRIIPALETAPVAEVSTAGTTEILPTPTATPEVKGEQTAASSNFNPLFLIIAPAAVLASAVLLPEFAAAAGVTAVAGGITYVLGSISNGTMPPSTFRLVLIIEIIVLIIISYFFLKHENKISKKIRGHHHRFRIR